MLGTINLINLYIFNYNQFGFRKGFFNYAFRHIYECINVKDKVGIKNIY